MRYLEVGKIVTTHGIKGEVKIKISSNNVHRFDVNSQLFMGEQKEKIIINSSRMHKNMMLITFNNYNNINDVLKYIGLNIYCDTDLDNNEDDGTFYYDDLIDCKVLVNNKIIGVVIDVMEVPQGEILRIKLNDDQIKLVPFVDEFIGNVDINAKTIEVLPIEGLL